MRRVLIILGASVSLMLFGVQVARAAELYPYSAETTVQNNGTATIELRLDSEGKIVNAVEATVRYDTKVLRLSGMSTGGSFISLWAESPKETAEGVIELAGGIPNGAVIKGGKLVTMTFEVIGLGSTVVRVSADGSGVYLDDGEGTKDPLRVDDITLTAQSASFGPRVASPTMPFEERWYPANTFTAYWTVYPGTSVSYMISPDPQAVPDSVPEDNLGIVHFPNLIDGVWYFSIKELFGGDEWGTVTRRAVRIDTVSPEPFDVTVLDDGGRTFVSFMATDRTSGVARYAARIERHRLLMPWRKLIEERTVTDPFAVDDIRSISRITVYAYDAAGNRREATWNSPRFEDGTRVLILMALSLIVGLSGILYLIVTARTGRPRQFPVRSKR